MNTSPLAGLVALVALSSLTVACGPSLSTLHAEAGRGEVQSDAPLHARQAVVIAAPREKVWALLTGFSAWPSWQPEISRMSAPRAVREGETFVWKTGDTEITSQIALVRPNEELAWTGTASVAKAIHVWRLSSPTPDTTRIETEETMDGPLLTWFYGQKELDRDMARSLANLTTAATAPSRASM